MKNLYYRSFLLLVVLFISLQTAQGQNFGYVNSQAILAEMPEVKQAEANLEALQKQLQKRGQDMLTQLQADYLKIQQKIERGELSPAQQEQEAAKLQERQNQIAKEEQDMVAQIQNKRAELLEPIYNKINNAIALVANENGYKMVFEQGVLLYASDALDVSRQVRAKLGF